eukprot:1185831-Prorocentrum_minimum.AAC.2
MPYREDKHYEPVSEDHAAFTTSNQPCSLSLYKRGGGVLWDGASARRALVPLGGGERPHQEKRKPILTAEGGVVETCIHNTNKTNKSTQINLASAR